MTVLSICSWLLFSLFRPTIQHCPITGLYRLDGIRDSDFLNGSRLLFLQEDGHGVPAIFSKGLSDRVGYVYAKDLIAAFIIVTAIVLIDRFDDVVKHINSALNIHSGLL